MLIPGMAAAVEGQLLGVPTSYPLINTNVDTNLTCGYDGTTLTLQSQAADIELTPGGTVVMIFSDNTGNALGGLLDVTAQIDSGGNLISGSFTVTGAFLDGAIYGDPVAILTGDIVDFGILDSGSTDAADFRVNNLSGDLLNHPNWPAGTIEVGVLVDMVNSAYDAATGFGGMTPAPWNCATSKASAGPIPGEQDGCNLTVVKTASTDTVGPLHTYGGKGSRKHDDSDTDSDSGRDHDRSGDSDDSDSDSGSGASHSDSDSGNTMDACGCKGRIKSLTLMWNSQYAETVEVKNNKGHVLYAATLVQPGEEFTFPVSGKRIKLIANGQVVKKLKTKCSNAVGAGQTFGNFVVVTGTSKLKNNVPLCPYPGASCDPEFEVTYSYVVTNTGPGNATNVVVYDDQLGVIGSYVNDPELVILAPNTPFNIEVTTCVVEDTTNIVTATGTDDTGELCTFTPDADGNGSDDNTWFVELLPPTCGPDDSDSDSHHDSNGNGDTDDSDSGHRSDSHRDHNGNGDSDDSDSDEKSDCDGDGH